LIEAIELYINARGRLKWVTCSAKQKRIFFLSED